MLTVEDARLIYESVIIDKGAKILKGAIIQEGAIIQSGASIHSGAKIFKCSTIKSGASIPSGTSISSGTVIASDAMIGVNRKNVTHNIVISGIGETQNITGYVCDDGIIVNIGCQNNYMGRTIPEMRKEIAKKYPPGHEYYDALDLIEKFLTRKIKGDKK